MNDIYYTVLPYTIPGSGEALPAIPGVGGTDYPLYSSVPDTGFDCSEQEYPGIYTDTQADCQVTLLAR